MIGIFHIDISFLAPRLYSVPTMIVLLCNTSIFSRFSLWINTLHTFTVLGKKKLHDILSFNCTCKRYIYLSQWQVSHTALNTFFFRHCWPASIVEFQQIHSSLVIISIFWPEYSFNSVFRSQNKTHVHIMRRGHRRTSL